MVGGLDWRGPEYLDEVKDGQVILIQHNRGSWVHQDTSRNSCVVVTRLSQRFATFGPAEFSPNEIRFWTYFDAPKLG